MELIERRNILSLIGRDGRKYHSCLMTSFSFDYLFFEQRIMHTLRVNKVQNVVALVDGSNLARANELLSGQEVVRGNSYSTCPVYAQGAFHPKMLLLAGEKNGLLLIGSGNLSSSGLSTNDEIWAAFQLSDSDNDNAFLFGAAWAYFNNLSSSFRGTNSKKLEWVSRYAPWIRSLPIDQYHGEIKEAKTEAWFLANSKKASIFDQIVKTIPSQEIEAITVISPYYDEKGLFLTDLHTHFEPKEMHCCVDLKSGLLPHLLDKGWKQKIKFYDWSEVRKDFNSDFNRLHAKLIHFKTSGDTEYLLFGSSNATIAGMGGINKRAINDEVNLLIKRNATSDWLSQLAININPSNRTTIPEKEKKEKETEPATSLPFRIDYVEINQSTLTLYLGKSDVTSVLLVSEDLQGTALETNECSVSEQVVSIKCSSNTAKSAVRLFFSDENGNRISNFALIHSVEALERSNPDPSKARITQLLNKTEFTAKDWSELLNIVSLSEFENHTVRSSSTYSGGGRGRKESKDDPQTESDDYVTTSKDEFNKQGENEQIIDRHYRSNAGHVYSFLSDRGVNIVSNDSFEESEEQKLAQNPDSGGEGDKIEDRKPSVPNDSPDIQRSIINYLNKVERHYNTKIKGIDSQSKNTKLHKVSGEAIKDLLIALQLIILFKDRKYEVEVANESDKEVVSKLYFEEGSLGSGNDTIKGFLLSVIGKFAYICRALGYVEYNDTEQQESLTALRMDAFNKTMQLIHEIQWNRMPELNMRKLLILNILEYICPNAESVNLNDFGSDVPELIRKETEHILEEYRQWKKLYKNQELKKRVLIRGLHQNSRNKFLFHGEVGFAFLEEVVKMKPRVVVKLQHPAFDKRNNYTKKVKFYPSIVQFKLK
ncbi:MAG: hypothetical protein CL666_03830 [Balneola sp.]|nr:hypothetical protein [Balneola sp.]|tara:strand:- start:76888 stop:79524 length:2637 start_codon:yes stop_codon:yes gene_type:complete